MLTVPRHVPRPNPRLDKLPVSSATAAVAVLKVRSSSEEYGQPPASVGRNRRMVLGPQGRSKLNPRPDRDFYSFPRLVKHVDDGFIATLTDLYRERLRPDSEVLDLMSSWVSHLPPEVTYKRVVGHGMNAEELRRNPRLDYFFVKDLNEAQELRMETSSLDAVVCAVGVQYLQWPERVFSEVARVLRPGGVFVVSFSGRMFYEKAVAAWRDGSPEGRTRLVVDYFRCVEGFTEPEVVRRRRRRTSSAGDGGGGGDPASPILGGFLDLLGLGGLLSSDPFYAVIAYRNFRPTL